MKKLQPLGLVVEGKLTSSALLRSSAILAQLGPVKSRTARLAKRATNFLRAGTPVESYEDFEEVDTILLHVPDPAVTPIVQELTNAPFLFKSKSFVLCETWMSTQVLRPLIGLGAATATCMALPTARGKWFILEGAGSVTKPLRKLLDRDDARAIEIEAGRKDLVFAAELLAGVLPLALLARAESALRSASLSGRQLRALLDGMLQRMLHDAATSHGPNPSPALRRCPPEVANQHLETLSETEPELAQFVKQQIKALQMTDILRLSAKLKEDEQAVPLETERA